VNTKSAKRGGSYEYQYHRNTGLEKLAKDMEVGHLFFDYYDNLKEVDLRYLHGSQLAEYFGKWRSECPNPYPQRYRKNVPYGFVKQHGTLLMTLKDGEVAFPTLAGGAPPASIVAEGRELDPPEE
jgi:hypothetical protein